MHNLISFDTSKDRVVLGLIDSAEMQRLRRIRQLGVSYVTYLGAEHSRFAHSLGCAYLMSRMFDRLVSLQRSGADKGLLNGIGDYRDLLICSALLHDLGHGPFSHAIEGITGIKHERWTRDIILNPDTEVNHWLKNRNDRFPGQVADVIDKIFTPSYVVKLLSSQLDVDRIDYLLRDSLMTGADYGKFDLDWLLRCIEVGEVHEEVEIGINHRKGLMVAEDFVLARRAMYLQVYFHKTTRGAEVLIHSILNRASDLAKEGAVLTQYGPLESLLKGADLKVKDYIGLDDHVILFHINKWLNAKDRILADLCGRFLHRRLFKSLPLDEYPDDYVDTVIKLRKACDDLGLPHQYYIKEDRAPHETYQDYYIANPRSSEDRKEDDNEVSERIYLFNEYGDYEELSVASAIIGAIRNKKTIVKRLYYPKEIEGVVSKCLKRR